MRGPEIQRHLPAPAALVAQDVHDAGIALTLRDPDVVVVVVEPLRAALGIATRIDRGAARLVQVRHHGHERRGGAVTREPSRVAGAVPITTVMLLLPGIHDRNAVTHNRIRKDILRECHVIRVPREAGLVVVLGERAEEGDVGAGRIHRLHGGNEGGGCIIRGLEELRRLVVHWVVEDAVERLSRGGRLIWADEIDAPVRNFADGVNGCGGLEGAPEVRFDVLDRINADAVDGVIGHEALDPGLVRRADAWLGGIEVRAGILLVADPADDHILVVGGVVVITDPAEIVEVGGIVEGDHSGVVKGGGRAVGAEMVGDDVDHEEHATGMERGGEGGEVFGGAEFGVRAVEVALHVAGIAAGWVVNLLRDGGDPDGVEAHVLWQSR